MWRHGTFPPGCRHPARALVVLILLASGFVRYRYLTGADQATVEVAHWVKANTIDHHIILYQVRWQPH